MASNGLLSYPKRGKCRICRRQRSVDKLKPVGEVRHGYATGYIWECLDEKECEKVAIKRSNDKSRLDADIIKSELRIGRYKKYVYKS